MSEPLHDDKTRAPHPNGENSCDGRDGYFTAYHVGHQWVCTDQNCSWRRAQIPRGENDVDAASTGATPTDRITTDEAAPAGNSRDGGERPAPATTLSAGALGTEDVSLADCPIGLFMHDGELCLKTEYGNNDGQIDAYIVSSGEYFWGGTSKAMDQRRVMVRPCTISATERTTKQLEVMLAWAEGDLSEGQAAKALGLDRLALREMRDAARASGVKSC